MIDNLINAIETNGYVYLDSSENEIPNTLISDKFYLIKFANYNNELNFSSNFDLGTLTIELILTFINESKEKYFQRLYDIRDLILNLKDIEGYLGFIDFTYSKTESDPNKSIAKVTIKWRFQ
jgi:hypothetical protein